MDFSSQNEGQTIQWPKEKGYKEEKSLKILKR